MTAAEIVLHPNDILRTSCEPVEAFDDDLGQILQTMRVTMASAKGIGLAAPQIGLTRRIALVGKFAMINPRIVWASEAQTVLDEGCLSIPGSRTMVLRRSSVEVEYFDPSGRSKKIRLNDKMAKCAQHEIDHLNGVLIIDRAFAEAA
ncbi:peptide deformylase [Agrobacterium rubi]|nr:peptide deformylase [Agrobacterium rubi]NTF23668.1 peptide deformylase [Agrobacterium rubi]